MKIKFTKPVSPGLPSSGGGLVKTLYNNGLRDQFSPNNYNCDYCQKGFSSRSNKNRHMLLSCDAKANIGTKRNASAEPSTNTNQGISAQGSSFEVDTHSVSSNLQSTKRKSSSHAISSRDNDFIYDPQIRPHRQGNYKSLLRQYKIFFSTYLFFYDNSVYTHTINNYPFQNLNKNAHILNVTRFMVAVHFSNGIY
jgi:hypothetical protein